MADLIALYRGHGLESTAGELPDFLPLFLEFLSLLPDTEARALLAEPAGILQALADRLVTRNTAYAAVIAGARRHRQRAGDRLARHHRREDPDDLEALDAAWEEAAVRFGPGEADRRCGHRPRCAPGCARATRDCQRPSLDRSRETMSYLSQQRPLRLVPVCGLTVFLLGSLLRFDTAQYTWRTGSSQLLRQRQLMLGIEPLSCRHPGHFRRPFRRLADARWASSTALGISHALQAAACDDASAASPADRLLIGIAVADPPALVSTRASATPPALAISRSC